MPTIRRRPAPTAQRPFPGAMLAATLSGAMGSALAADTSCAALAKAVQAGMAQARIHAAIDGPQDAFAPKPGQKPTLMHSIVIDKVQHLQTNASGFHRVALNSPDDRALATDLAAFEAEAGCRSAGAERVAGRSAQVYAFSFDLGRGEGRVKVWVDTASGLPVRAVTDEPDVDVHSGFATKPGAGKGSAPKFEVTEPNGKRVIATHAYVYGDAVKPPGANGALDPAALAHLQALLKGAP